MTDSPRSPRLRTCSVPGCSITGLSVSRPPEGVPRITKGMCGKHYQRWLKHSDTSVVLRGVNHPNYSGLNASYKTAHLRVRQERGPARNYLCSFGCESAAQEWAYDGSDPNQRYEQMRSDRPLMAYYSLDPSFYMPVCIRCHRRHDSAAAAEELREYRTWKHRTGLTLEDIE